MKAQKQLDLLRFILQAIKAKYEKYGLAISKDDIIAHAKINGFPKADTAAMIESANVAVFCSISRYTSGRITYLWSDRRSPIKTAVKYPRSSVWCSPSTKEITYMISSLKTTLSKTKFDIEKPELKKEISYLKKLQKDISSHKAKKIHTIKIQIENNHDTKTI